MDFYNNYLIINERNDSNTQKFIFKKCLYNIPKTDLWKKWEKYRYREFRENNCYIIRSAENENIVLNYNSSTNNLEFNYLNGNKEQLFIIIKNHNNIFLIPFLFSKEINSNFVKFIINNLLNNLDLRKLRINKDNSDYNGISLYNILNENDLYLDTSISYKSLQFNYSNGYNTQKFYFSLVQSFIFKEYLVKSLIGY